MSDDDIQTTRTLERLEEQVQEALGALNEMQRAFVLQFVDGEAGNGAEAARLAGYTSESSRQAAHQLKQKPHVARAIELLRYRKELRIGIAGERKRAILMDIAERHRVESPNASVAAVRTLMDLDGDKAELQVRLNGTIRHEAPPMSDTELIIRLQAMERQVGHSLVMPNGKLNPTLLGAAPVIDGEVIQDDDDDSLF